MCLGISEWRHVPYQTVVRYHPLHQSINQTFEKYHLSNANHSLSMGLSHDEQIHLRVNVIEIQQQYSWTCLFDA